MKVNKDTPEGTPVLLVEDNGSVTKTVTRSEAWMLGGELVVMVNDRTGGYLASRMTIDEDPLGVEYIRPMTSMNRFDIINRKLFSVFCKNCGDETSDTCHCWNDE